jgi:hypothetical protein
MIWDVVSGWSEKLADGSAIWAIADDLKKHNTVRRHLWDADLVPFLKDHKGGLCDIDVLVIIAGVNRVWDGQAWEKCWVIPACIKTSVCFVTRYPGNPAGMLAVIPECCPIRNPSEVHRNVECFWGGVDHSSIVSLPLVRETIRELSAKFAGVAGRGMVVYSYGCADLFKAIGKFETAYLGPATEGEA